MAAARFEEKLMAWYWWMCLAPSFYLAIGGFFAWVNSKIDPDENRWSHGLVLCLHPFYALYLLCLVAHLVVTLTIDKLIRGF